MIRNKILIKENKKNKNTKKLDNNNNLDKMERINVDLNKKLKDNMDIYFNFYPVFGLTNIVIITLGNNKGLNEIMMLHKNEIKENKKKR